MGRLARRVTGDATDNVAENAAMVRFVRNVTGARTINVARAAAAGRVLKMINVSHKFKKQWSDIVNLDTGV